MNGHPVRLFAMSALAGLAGLSGQESADASRVLAGHRAGLTGVKFSPDGKSIASSSLDGNVRLWWAKDGSLIRELKHGAEIYAIAFAPDGELIASSGLDGRIVFWDAGSGESLSEVKLPEWSVAIAFTRDGALAVGSVDGKVRVIDPISAELRQTIDTGSEVLGLAISPDPGTDKERIATSTPIKLWDLESGKLVKSLAGFGQGGLAFSPDGELLASAEWTGGAQVWSAKNGALGATLRLDAKKQVFGPAGAEQITVNMPVAAVTFSSDGGLLATGGSDFHVQLWTSTASRVDPSSAKILAGHTATVTSVAISPDGRQLASASLDRTVRVWTLK